MNKQCCTCILWERAIKNNDPNQICGHSKNGLCHRYPETYKKLQHDFCGEWRKEL